MPYIEEDKFLLMQQDLDNAKLKREDAEKQFDEIENKYIQHKKGSKRTSIFLGLLLGAALGIIYLFNSGKIPSSNNHIKSPEIDIAAIKNAEAERVIDSLSNLQIETNTNENDSGISGDDLDESVTNIKENANGTEIYSVQIGVFSNKKYPLISTKLLPGTINSSDGYFKYSLGLFTSLNEAKYLKNELIRIGFKDAFIASYINGKRQKIHQ
ncbi:hypothetical protein OAT18_01855 [Tenacibaculum sp.]|nr:hypothetical protein [Tenacibaculum sp.]